MSRLFINFNLSGILILIFLILESACHSQTREAAVAGQFYPGSSSELKKELENLFAPKNDFKEEGKVLAIIAPHAGYVFSGPVAAESFEQIDRNSQYDNIFLIGSSHRFVFDGASIYTLGNFRTPLGEVPVNLDLAKELCRKFSVFTTRTDAQINEHSLEVQLPFLQYWLKKPFRIIPIVLGTQNVATCHKISRGPASVFQSIQPFCDQYGFLSLPCLY